MPAPKVTITVLDGSLGQVPAGSADAQLKLGICSGDVPNTFYTQSDIATAQANLGQGPLVEAVGQAIAAGGGPIYAVPLTPTGVGTASSVVHSGSGAGTVSVTSAPAKTILVKISTSGALGTAQIQVNVGGAGYQPPVLTTVTTFSYLVPGTLTTITLAAQTYTAGDVWTISTLGVITVVGVGTASWITQVSSPLDFYQAIVTILVAGGLGTAVFQYSLDNGNTPSGSIATPGGGSYAIPDSGLVLTFASTFVAGDTYTFTTTTATANNTSITNAFTFAFGLAAQWAFAHVAATPANAAAAATTAATVDAQMSVAFVSYRFIRAFVECPTSESDATVIAAFAAFASTRVSVCAGDVGMLSPITGLVNRRNCAWPISAHASAVSAGEDLAFVGTSSPVKNVVSLYRDEAKTPGFDDARFSSMTTMQGKIGYFITNARLMSQPGSDFVYFQHGRVMDIACNVTRAVLLDYLSGSVRISLDPATLGGIDERDARRIEGRVNAALKVALIDTSIATAASCVLSRTQNILSTSTEPVSVRVTPLGYLKELDATIGFSNPALAVAA